MVQDMEIYQIDAELTRHDLGVQLGNRFQLH